MSWAAAFAQRHGLSVEATAELLALAGAPMSGVFGEALLAPETSSDPGLTLLSLVGRGGLGEVHRAHDGPLDRVVALKVLRADRRHDPTAAAQFHAEAHILASLQHPGIPPVHEVGVLPDGRPYVSMLEVVGSPLRQVALDHHQGRSPRSLRRRVALVLRLAEATAHAHRRGVVHRDITPSNVLVGPRDTVHLVDWGLAVHTPAPRGPVVGTPGFIAPEVEAGAAHGPASDVYALGRVLHGLVDPAALDAIQPPPDALPDGLDILLSRALDAAPEARWPDAEALADALTAWLDGAARLQRARELVAASAEAHGAWVDADARARRHADAARDALRGVRPADPIDDKRTGWALQDAHLEASAEARALQQRRLRLLEEALSLAPELPEALEPLARWHREASDAAAGRRDTIAAQAHLEQVARYDRGTHRAWLAGLARLTLVTEPAGAEVTLCAYRSQDRQLVPVRERSLGRTPLTVDLPHGRMLLLIDAPGHATVRYPVALSRLEHWTGGLDERIEVVRLPEHGALGPDDLYIPAGPFVSGADASSGFQSLPVTRSFEPAFVMQRHPVTHGQYRDFLNALVEAGEVEHAHTLAPRERGMAHSFYGRDAHGRYALVADSDGDVWQADWPVFFIDAGSAEAYAAWLSDQTGHRWTLPGELQHEKALRGSDGRIYPWGDHFDATFACVRDSHLGRPLPASIDAYPVDCSVYGVRGLAGNVRAWCREAYAPPGGEVVESQRVLRGGCFFFPARGAHGAARMGFDAHRAGDTIGLRLVRALDAP